MTQTQTAKHTPGPWEVERVAEHTRLRIPTMDHVVTCGVGKYPGNRVVAGVSYVDGCSSEANARLIAAAPELLQALKDLRRELLAANLKLNVRKHFSLMSADAKAGTAIARAEGGAI